MSGQIVACIKNLVLLVCLGSQVYVYGQIVTIKDQQTGRPLELAVLVNQNHSLFVSTNAQGQADMMGFVPGDTIQIQLMGYRTTRIPLQVLDSHNYHIHLHPTNISLDQVVVSANRWNQPKRDIPAKVTTISSADVAFQNAQTTADALNVSGEVFIQKSQLGGGSPMIRGFSTNRLLYSVDGVRMNTAIFRSGNLQNVIALDHHAIENTEVLFGPGSVIYGSDAIGAVMSFQTIKPQLSLSSKPLIKGKSVLRYASASQEKTFHANINAGWKKWAIVTSVTATGYDDLKMGQHGPDSYLRPFYVQRKDNQDVIIDNDDQRRQVPTGYNQLNLMQKVLYEASSDMEFEFGFHYSRSGDIPRYDRHIRLRDGKPRSAEWYYGPQVWVMNQLSMKHNGKGILYDQISVRLAYQYFEESRHDRDFGEPTLFERIEKVNAYSINVDLTRRLSGRTTLFYGIEAVHDDVDSRGFANNIETTQRVVGASRYPLSTWSSYGAYASMRHKFSSQWSVQAGLRYNYFALDSDFSDNLDFYPLPFEEADIKQGAVTGSIGLVYKPTDEWSIHGHFSTGFRAPNVDDIGKIFDSEPGSVVVPNPDLDAEYAYNYELGIARIFDNFLKVDVSAYYTSLENAMVRRDYQLNGMDSIMYDGELSQVQAIQNAARSTVIGLQAGIEVNLPYGFEIASRYNYQKGEEELDNGSVSPSRHAAPAFGTTSVCYRTGKLQMMGYIIYNAEVDADEMPVEEVGKDYLYASDKDGNPYSPGWYTLNLKGAYQFSHHLELQVGVENITNQRYRPYSSGLVAPGINFIVALRASI